MSLIPWKTNTLRRSPLSDLEAIQDQFHRLFGFPVLRWGEVDKEFGERAWTPAIDVIEKDDHYRIVTDLPGVNKDDIHVSLDGDILSIRGEKRNETQSDENGVLRAERNFGSFYRGLTLPAAADGANVKASYKDGVLTLTVPKRDEAKPKQIDIRVD